MVIYDSEALYIESKQTLCDKIQAIDDIIDALTVTALKSAGKNDVSEYWLDDGQTKIKTVNRGTDEITKSIQSFLSIKELYVNQLNGRVFKMTDYRTIIRSKR
ncbi:MAG: hypothetical protein ACPGSO_02910 [Vicingaceae bacterium]